MAFVNQSETSRSGTGYDDGFVDAVCSPAGLRGGSGCSGKPWATSSREELRQLKQGAHRWDCIQYRYGYLTRTLLADPNASRCANALWLQRREIEELGLAKPGDWGTSVGVTLL